MKKVFRKCARKQGFTLIEMLVTIAILAIMVVAIGDGMSAATRIYKEAVFASNSSILGSMLNTTFEDLFRYSEEIYLPDDETGDYYNARTGRLIDGKSVPGKPALLFTNDEYGAQYAYVDVNTSLPTNPVQIHNVFGGQTRDLLNMGAYPNLKVEKLQVAFDNPLYIVSYEIKSTVPGESMTKEMKLKVRLLNGGEQKPEDSDETLPDGET